MALAGSPAGDKRGQGQAIEDGAACPCPSVSPGSGAGFVHPGKWGPCPEHPTTRSPPYRELTRLGVTEEGARGGGLVRHPANRRGSVLGAAPGLAPPCFQGQRGIVQAGSSVSCSSGAGSCGQLEREAGSQSREETPLGRTLSFIKRMTGKTKVRRGSRRGGGGNSFP